MIQMIDGNDVKTAGLDFTLSHPQDTIQGPARLVIHQSLRKYTGFLM